MRRHSTGALPALRPEDYASKRYQLIHVPTHENSIQSPVYAASYSVEDLLARLSKLNDDEKLRKEYPDLGVLDTHTGQIA